jgi:hypothetical protein
VVASGGKLRRPARVRTPFILERANSSKGEGAKLWAFGLRAGGRQAAEGNGQAKSPSVPEQSHLADFKVSVLVIDPGTGDAGYAKACLAFFLANSFRLA